MEVLGSLKFYIIGSSVGWCVVRGIGAEVDIYICDGLDSDVGGDVESGDYGKVESEVCYENCIRFVDVSKMK